MYLTFISLALRLQGLECTCKPMQKLHISKYLICKTTGNIVSYKLENVQKNGILHTYAQLASPHTES